MSRPLPPSRLTPDLLLQAYAIGYFPMAEDRYAKDVFWVRPDLRGVLPIKGLHISKTLRRTVRRDVFEIRTDTAFRAVMEGCAMPQTERWQTWINGQILSAYAELHEQGYAHSVEAWRDGQLVGGLYGVAIGGAFFGESMFSVVTDASKVALVHLTARLAAGGYVLHDTQFTTDHLRRFGVEEVAADNYARRLSGALKVDGRFDALPPQMAGSTILQSITQTS
ncbi:leucyl/phenylalanyl-tRNA--protein transferase [Parvularcula oceani]|uniref:leucyl/phenylalanyl-tRNA--protein transferase n=1 Tax=Parvularcula oceani TaxID=1247963 RepID=UPI0004E20850|nr:leucyl/phenylalanyl-tRNA--protein transferase [Parvularcula oceani]